MRRMHAPQLAEARRLYESGMSTIAIGEAMGFDHQTVRKHLKRAGAEIRRRGRVPREFDLGRARELYDSGMSCKSVGAEMGVSGYMVLERFRLAGIPRRKEWAKGVRKCAREARSIPAERLIELFSNGLVASEIAREVRCGQARIKGLLEGAGFEAPSRGEAKRSGRRAYYFEDGRVVDPLGHPLRYFPGHPLASPGGYVREGDLEGT
jgi:hypothetical protein